MTCPKAIICVMYVSLLAICGIITAWHDGFSAILMLISRCYVVAKYIGVL